jgi:hypothetical protein
MIKLAAKYNNYSCYVIKNKSVMDRWRMKVFATELYIPHHIKPVDIIF